VKVPKRIRRILSINDENVRTEFFGEEGYFKWETLSTDKLPMTGWNFFMKGVYRHYLKKRPEIKKKISILQLKSRSNIETRNEQKLFRI
jgi:hypothetical protein